MSRVFLASRNAKKLAEKGCADLTRLQHEALAR